MFFPHVPVDFVKCTSPSFRKAAPQHDAATPLRLTNFPHFSKEIKIIRAKHLNFNFIWPQDMTPELLSFQLFLELDVYNHRYWHYYQTLNTVF